MLFGGVVIADSRRAIVLWEPPRPTPTYYIPQEDVRMELLVPSGHTRQSQAMGQASYWNVEATPRIAENAAWSYPQSPLGAPEIAAYVAFDWNQMDAWYEEDEEVFVHPRDPHHRVDAMNSSRHVRVELDGQTVAESRRPVLLFETGLLVRYYLPKLDVRMDLFSPSPTVTQCPYKGTAAHWNFDGDAAQITDVAWSYHLALPECAKIANLVAFYNERVDAIYVDGELQEAPVTPWSRPRQ